MGKIVITGGPSAGKTTTIDCLKELGFETVSESALRVIRQQAQLENAILPWTNPAKFQELAFDHGRQGVGRFAGQVSQDAHDKR